VSECDREAPVMGSPGQIGSCCSMKKLSIPNSSSVIKINNNSNNNNNNNLPAK
jgi:hypothetical protein